MKTSYEQLKLKKGDKVYTVGSWNGYKDEVNSFYLCNWSVLACGKIQTYLTSDSGNSKHSFSSSRLTYLITDKDLSLAIEEALIDCAALLKEQLEYLNGQIDWNVSRGYAKEESDYIKGLRANVARIESNPCELYVFSQWYTTGKSEIIQTIKF